MRNYCPIIEKDGVCGSWMSSGDMCSKHAARLRKFGDVLHVRGGVTETACGFYDKQSNGTVSVETNTSPLHKFRFVKSANPYRKDVYGNPLPTWKLEVDSHSWIGFPAVAGILSELCDNPDFVDTELIDVLYRYGFRHNSVRTAAAS